MIDFENNFYEFDEKNNTLKFFSDEFEKLLLRCNITLDSIELNVETGDIYCYTNPINYKNVNCKKFDQVLKNNVPYIQDVILQEEYFILIFNIDVIILS